MKEKVFPREEFVDWKDGLVFCPKNFDGKSGMMVTEAAVRVWRRCEAHVFRYISFIDDGNSSASRAVSPLNDAAGPNESCTAFEVE